jgi:hypothetical protein
MREYRYVDGDGDGFRLCNANAPYPTTTVSNTTNNLITSYLPADRGLSFGEADPGYDYNVVNYCATQYRLYFV